MTEATLSLVEPELVLSLFGTCDQHLRTVREALGVSIAHRDGEVRVMNTGDVLVVPQGRVHSFAGVGDTLILEVSTPSLVADNFFEDPVSAAWLKNTL